MTMLSTTAWVAHDLSLASAFGGSLFGKLAFEPSLSELGDSRERVSVEDGAWRRFSVLNTIALGTFALTWFTGRKMLSGREVSSAARGLTIAKDVLVGTSVAVGIGSVVLGRLLSRAMKRDPRSDRTRKLNRTVDVLGSAELLCTAGVLGLTSMLAMQAGKSTKFSAISRLLP